MTEQKFIKNFTSAPEFRLLLIAVCVFGLMSVLSPDRFLSSQNLTSMAFQFPEFAILALAMTIAMMTGGIDLSVGGCVANLSAVLAAIIPDELLRTRDGTRAIRVVAGASHRRGAPDWGHCGPRERFSDSLFWSATASWQRSDQGWSSPVLPLL